MASWKFLAFGLLSLCGCATQVTGQNQSAKVITVDASAANCTQAEKQAKIKAVDFASGTFVQGQRTLIDDKDYSEQMKEYSSGVIQKYTVLEKKGKSPCTVKIEAWIAPGQKALLIEQQTGVIGVDEINLRASQLKNNRQFLAQHFRDTQQFSVILGQMELIDADPGTIDVALALLDVRPAQRWLDDLEAYLSIEGQPTIYRQESRTNALGRLITGERKGTEPPPAPWAHEICFMHQAVKEIHCYTGEVNRKIIRVLRRPVVELDLTVGNQSQRFSQGSLGLGFYNHKPVGYRYISSGYAPRSDFPLISAWPLPGRVGLTYRGKQLPENAKISGVVRFDGLSEFPLNQLDRGALK